MLRHLKTHFSYNSKLVSGESPEEGSKKKVTQYEFVAHWLATGLPHYQVTRPTFSGMYNFLKEKTNCPVSSSNTFDKHRDTFLDLTTAKMSKAMENQFLFIIGDSSPDGLKREWTNF